MVERRFLVEARNRVLAVEDGVIAEPSGRYELVLRFPDADVRPGLINAHDHLHRNHYGRLGAPPYPDARAWADDVAVRQRAAIARGRTVPRRRALLHGAWKNLLAGVTSVVHHDRWEADFERHFPLRVVPIACADSLDDFASLASLQRGELACVHLAEGTSRRAASEVGRLHRRGLLGPELLAVHCVGADAQGVALLRTAAAAVIWCPTSNLFLYSRTAPAQLLDDGIDVLLGSDSRLSGDGDLLDELRLARGLGLVEDARLEAAVGATAARRLGIERATLAPGERADLVVLARPLLEASAADVRLVVAGGEPRVATRASAIALEGAGYHGRSLRHAGLDRWIFAEPGEGPLDRAGDEPIPPLVASTGWARQPGLAR